MKTRIKQLIFGLMLAGFIAAVFAINTASASKWYQPVDLQNGVDVSSYYLTGDERSQVAADDWICDDAATITNITWWGAYSGYNGSSAPTNQISSFWFAIYSDVSADSEREVMPWSHPDAHQVVWSASIDDVNETYFGEQELAGQSAFKYSITLDNPFQQVEGTTYWLAIWAGMDDAASHTWGWKTTALEHNWNDAAVTSSNFVYWDDIYYEYGHPYEGERVNLAFILNDDGEEIPEPATLILLGSLATGLFGTAGMKRRFAKK
ncbi:MAG: PEP-CTERM sorting domain-containing protein [Candidatus Omnitrophica bacterium]|nr:PEP-CTERM sorting domain-containing protein [Candidatus Omnitrophota bacterium]